MSYCEDYPCCGHVAGDCPSYTKSGRLKCTCGRVLPKGWRYSICRSCLRPSKHYAFDGTGQDYEAGF